MPYLATMSSFTDSPSEAGRPGRSGLAGLLFFLTIVSTTFAGASQHLSDGTGSRHWQALAAGLWYALPLCLILACHEAGHYLLARRHRVPVSLPYFIPFPLGLGTLGAVIGLRSEVRDRNALFDVAPQAPGRLAVALPVLVCGLSARRWGRCSPVTSLRGSPLLYLGLKLLVKGQLLPGRVGSTLLDVQLHPLAMAGWAGLLITMMNLLPIGQLDGGHIAAAYFGKDHERRSRWLHRGLLLIWLATSSLAAWQVRQRGLLPALGQGAGAGLFWLVWGGALLIMRAAPRAAPGTPRWRRPPLARQAGAVLGDAGPAMLVVHALPDAGGIMITSCPKCGRTAKDTDTACARCGLLRKRWDGFHGQAAAHPLLDPLWQEAEKDWDNEKRHSALAAVATADWSVLSALAQRYNRVLRQRPQDAVAARAMDQLIKLAMGLPLPVQNKRGRAWIQWARGALGLFLLIVSVWLMLLLWHRMGAAPR